MSRNPPEVLEYSDWPTVDAELLPKEKKLRFKRLKVAVEAACNGMKAAEISIKYGVKRGQICYLIKRCTMVHFDGRLWGYRALITGCRQVSYQRTSPAHQEDGADGAGLAGSFAQLLRQHPKVLELIDKTTRSRRLGSVKEAGINLRSLHGRIIDLLRKEGVPSSDYPFNTRTNGYIALTRYIKARENAGDHSVAQDRYGLSALDGLQSGTGKRGVLRPLRPLEMVAYDEQKLPFIGTLVIEVDGKELDVPIHRGYLCLMADMNDGAILGYSVAISERFQSLDLLTAFESFLTPWRPRELTIPKMKYREGAGLPSGVVPQVYGRRIAMLHVDNHLTHLADSVVGHLRCRTGAIISFGKVRHWIRRAAVEGIFAELQKRGFIRLPSTTGSGPSDPAVDDPVGKAVKFKIRLEHLIELLDVLIANHNARSRNSLMSKTPNEDLASEFDERRRIAVVPRYSEKFLNDPQVAVDIVVCTVRGSRNNGRSPNIQLDGAHYTNDFLRQSWSMIGQRLTVHIKGDYRKVRAFRADGSEFGILEVTGHWARSFHTREMRKQINLLDRMKILDKHTDDPVTVYMEYLAHEATRNARKKRHKITRESGRLAEAMHAAPESAYRYKAQDEETGESVEPQLKTRGRRNFFS